MSWLKKLNLAGYIFMTLLFDKYQGAGNDFILIDDRDELFPIEDFNLIERLCNRRFGIGADGLILLRGGVNSLEMIYFNSDGRQSSMCGNGGRCFAAFALNRQIVDKKPFSFHAIDGLHEVEFTTNGVNLKMLNVEKIEKVESDYFLNTGSPHYVRICQNVKQTDIVSAAKEIRYNERFSAEGTNVNFVEPRKDKLLVRTYERGVEDETLACGTGVTAVALVAHELGINTHNNKSLIQAMGGELEVSYEPGERGYSNVWLKGPAEFVFTGKVEV